MSDKPLVTLSLIALLAFAAHSLAQQNVQINLKKTIPAPPSDERLLFVGIENDEIRSLSTDADVIRTAKAGRVSTDALSGLVVGFEKDVTSRFLALVTKGNTSRKSDDLKLTALDGIGEKRFEMKIPWANDEPFPTIAVSGKDGAIALGKSAVNEVRFFTADGALKRHVRLFENNEYSTERTLHIEADARSGLFAVAAIRTPASPGMLEPESNSKLFLFNSAGASLWETTLKEPSVYALKFFPNGTRLLTATYDAYRENGMIKKTRILDENGAVVKEHDFLFRDAVFDETNGAALLYEKGKFYALDLDSGEIIAQGEGEKDELILAASFSANKSASAILFAKEVFKDGGLRYESPVLRFFESGGALVGNYRPKGERLRKPFFAISEDRQAIVLVTAQRFEILDWVE